ncbi:hypothetical protein Hanom_Chr03g00274261 [Helianthus anomalus]
MSLSSFLLSLESRSWRREGGGGGGGDTSGFSFGMELLLSSTSPVAVPVPVPVPLTSPSSLRSRFLPPSTASTGIFIPSAIVVDVKIANPRTGGYCSREKMLLFICIFGGTLFTRYNFLIYFESSCEWKLEKNVMIILFN